MELFLINQWDGLVPAFTVYIYMYITYHSMHMRPCFSRCLGPLPLKNIEKPKLASTRSRPYVSFTRLNEFGSFFSVFSEGDDPKKTPLKCDVIRDMLAHKRIVLFWYKCIHYSG